MPPDSIATPTLQQWRREFKHVFESIKAVVALAAIKLRTGSGESRVPAIPS